jgi:DNA invertase Pin-like site-specific DNA recombinase
MIDEEEFSARSQLKWTRAPTGKLMFQITGAFAQFERSIIRQRVA